MSRLSERIAYLVLMSAVAAYFGAVAAAAEESVWIEGGESRVAIVADSEILELDPDARANRERAPMNWAVHDLADYLEKMTGVRPVITSEPSAETLQITIRLKEEGEDIGAESEFGDAYRIDIREDGAELVGERYDSTAYAVYHVLHDLGVRWYGPVEWAEVVPERDRIAFEKGVRVYTPDYHSRALWGVCRKWLIRNRMPGQRMPEGHGFFRFMQGMEPRDKAPLVERHPEYYPIVDGEVRGRQANLSHPDVLERAIKHVRDTFERNPDTLGTSLGPDDGALRDERPETRALMSGKPDPLFPHRQDSTDLLVWFINQVAEEIEDEYPDKLLGFYVYSNHSSVPDIEPHPMIYPKIAPISFSRYTSIGTPNAPTSMMLKDIIQEWVKLSPRVGVYLYNWNLADFAMPFTRVAAFRRDLPNLHNWGLEYATIESGANWQNMVPGNYMIGRLLWDIETDVDALLEEFYPLYYGPAAEPMRRHDRLLQEAYENTSAYTGNKWSMHRILTPEVMEGLENNLNEALELVGDTEPYAKRLSVPSYTLNFAKAWFDARDALNRFDFEAAGEANRRFVDNYWRAHEDGLTTDEPSWRARSRPHDSPHNRNFFSMNVRRYWEIFHQSSFEEAEKIANDGTVILEFPDEWKGYFDQTAIGESLGLANPEYPKDSWLDMRTFSATIDEQGFPYYRGLIWYALDIEIPEISLEDDKEVFMWFGGNDSNTQVFIDGRKAGKFRTGNFQPGEASVTPYLRPGETQHVVVSVDNRPVCELGTGGIMRPVVLYKRALGEDEERTPFPEDFDPEDAPLFAPAE